MSRPHSREMNMNQDKDGRDFQRLEPTALLNGARAANLKPRGWVLKGHGRSSLLRTKGSGLHYKALRPLQHGHEGLPGLSWSGSPVPLIKEGSYFPTIGTEFVSAVLTGCQRPLDLSLRGQVEAHQGDSRARACSHQAHPALQSLSKAKAYPPFRA